jgi:tRNA 2-thiocytidine biosynthesis protein TtcA
MAVALRNLVPSHFMDPRHFDFQGLVANGVADADGDKAFDGEEFPQAIAMPVPR